MPRRPSVIPATGADGGPKGITVHPSNDHGGGQARHRLEQLTWLRSRLGLPPRAA